MVRMKVLFIEYYLPETLYILELGKPMTAYAEVDVFCKQTTPADAAPGIRLIPAYYAGGSKPQAMVRFARSLYALAHAILTGGYDVVHVSSFKKAKVEMKLYAWLRPRIKKLVHTVHNVLPHESSARDKKLWGDFYGLCDELIVHNEVTKRILMQTFDIPESKISVIAHGEFNTYPTSDRLTFREGQPVRFTLFGLVRKYKGIDVFLRAIAMLPPETRARARFTVIGRQFKNFDDTDYQGMIDQLGIGDCVRFIPERVEDPEIPKLYDETDVAVFPYRMIYGSGTLLMAYTFRKPVIVSDIPALLEETANGQTGLCFRSEDAADLARAITEATCWTESDYRTYVQHIAELAENRFNWKISAKKTYEVYCRQPRS